MNTPTRFPLFSFSHSQPPRPLRAIDISHNGLLQLTRIRAVHVIGSVRRARQSWVTAIGDTRGPAEGIGTRSRGRATREENVLVAQDRNGLVAWRAEVRVIGEAARVAHGCVAEPSVVFGGIFVFGERDGAKENGLEGRSRGNDGGAGEEDGGGCELHFNGRSGGWAYLFFGFNRLKSG